MANVKPIPEGYPEITPYLAVDGAGRVVASFPEQNRVVVFGADGQRLKEVSLQGNGSPVGVAVAADGRLVVADARGNVVVAIPAP